MKSDKLINKFARWTLLLQEYDFEVIHHTRTTNLDTSGFSHNPSPSDEDLTGARLHGDCDWEAVPGWHEATYLTLFSGVVVEVPIQGSNNEIVQPQAIADI